MHETRLVSMVISTLEREARKRNGKRISQVHLKLGQGPHNLEPDRVREVFALLARGTIAEGAELVIEEGAEGEEEVVIEKFAVSQQ